jgi:aspartate/glutamate racemase
MALNPSLLLKVTKINNLLDKSKPLHIVIKSTDLRLGTEFYHKAEEGIHASNADNRGPIFQCHFGPDCHKIPAYNSKHYPVSLEIDLDSLSGKEQIALLSYLYDEIIRKLEPEKAVETIKPKPTNSTSGQRKWKIPKLALNENTQNTQIIQQDDSDANNSLVKQNTIFILGGMGPVTGAIAAESFAKALPGGKNILIYSNPIFYRGAEMLAHPQKTLRWLKDHKEAINHAASCTEYQVATSNTYSVMKKLMTQLRAGLDYKNFYDIIPSAIHQLQFANKDCDKREYLLFGTKDTCKSNLFHQYANKSKANISFTVSSEETQNIVQKGINHAKHGNYDDANDEICKGIKRGIDEWRAKNPLKKTVNILEGCTEIPLIGDYFSKEQNKGFRDILKQQYPELTINFINPLDLTQKVIIDKFSTQPNTQDLGGKLTYEQMLNLLQKFAPDKNLKYRNISLGSSIENDVALALYDTQLSCLGKRSVNLLNLSEEISFEKAIEVMDGLSKKPAFEALSCLTSNQKLEYLQRFSKDAEKHQVR